MIDKEEMGVMLTILRLMLRRAPVMEESDMIAIFDLAAKYSAGKNLDKGEMLALKLMRSGFLKDDEVSTEDIIKSSFSDVEDFLDDQA